MNGGDRQRPRPGDAVTLPGLEVVFEVTGTMGARGLRLRAPSGRLVEADALAVRRLPRGTDRTGRRRPVAAVRGERP